MTYRNSIVTTSKATTSAVLVLASLAHGGCFTPSEAETSQTESATGTSATESSGGQDVGDESSSAPSTTTTTSETGEQEGTTQGEGDASDSVGESSTGDGPAPACGDGNVDPGELCFPDNPVTFAAGAGANRIAVGAFNPNLDVVTVNPAGFTLSILMGDGVGGFAPPISKSIGDPEQNGSAPYDVAIGDLDNDDDLDIIAVTPNELRWFRNNGGGEFAGSGDAHPINDFGGGGWIVLDNFDTDPALDVAWTEGYNTHFELGRVDGDGVFSLASADPASIQVTGGDGWVAATEFGFDGDGFRDIFVTGRFSNQGQTVPVRGNGNGTWSFDGVGQGGVDVCGEASCTPEFLQAADLDGNGEADILLAHDQGFSVALGGTDGTFAPGTPYPADGAHELVVIDIDADGEQDVLVATTSDQTIRIFRGVGDGALELALELPVGGDAEAVAVGDVNNDGALDVLTCHGDDVSGTVEVFLSTP